MEAIQALQILALAAALVSGLELEVVLAPTPTPVEVSSEPNLLVEALAQQIQALAASVAVAVVVLEVVQVRPTRASVVQGLPFKAPHRLARALAVLPSIHSPKKTTTLLL